MPVKLTRSIAGFWKDQSGATAIEYGFIAVLISIAGITAFATLGDSVSSLFGDISSNFEESVPGADSGRGRDGGNNDPGAVG